MRRILAVSLLSTVLTIAPALKAHAFTAGSDVEINAASIDLNVFGLNKWYFQDSSSLPPETATSATVAYSAQSAIESVSPAAAPTPQTSTLDEGFENINTLAQKGWFFQNNSSPPPATTTATANWVQGRASGSEYLAQAGGDEAYISASGFENTVAATAGQVSQWLLTPVLQFVAGGSFSFFTRTPNSNNRAELLEVLVSTSGDSTNVGNSATSVGDFKNLLLTVGSATDPTVYPGGIAATNNWTRFSSGTTTSYGGGFSSTFANLPTSGTGRLAFRWSGINAGSLPDFSDGNPTNLNIGIDTVSTNLAVAIPEPTTSALSGFALLSLRSLMRRRRQPE
jgi:hypothetical protein